MATQISIDVGDLTIKYRQPYVSEALNRKAKTGFGGVMRGFIPKIDPNIAQKILLDVDEQTGDSAMNIVNQLNPEFAIAWTLSAPLSVSVPNNAGYFHLYVDHGYIFGQDTAPTMTWFSTAEVIDQSIVKNGMYIVSVNGQDLNDIKTVFEISDSIAIKRATASSYRGSRTRVQGYDENVLYQTDFSDWQNSPIDITPDRQNHMSMSVVPSQGLADGILTTNSGQFDLDSIAPETNGCVLLAWRANQDNTNATVDFAFDYKKRFLLPHIIPINSAATELNGLERKVKIAIRHCGVRNTTVRPVNETASDKWHVKLNLKFDGKQTLEDATVGTETYKEIVNSNNLVIPNNQITLDPTKDDGVYLPWTWSVGELTIPNFDGQRTLQIVGASIEIVIPNMRNDEFFAIDRLVVEGTNLALSDPFDGSHEVDSLARYGAVIGDEISRTTLLSGTSRSLDITPTKSWDFNEGTTSDKNIVLDRVLHAVNIGLPLRDQNNLGRLEGQSEETALFSSEINSPSGYNHLRNIFKQSNVNIYSTGQYQTRDLITQYNAAGGNAPSSLKAPFRAGLTVHNGNVFALKSNATIESDLSTTAIGNNNLTGALIAEDKIVSTEHYVHRGVYDFDTGVLSPLPQTLTKVITGDNFLSATMTAITVVNHPVVNGQIAPQSTTTFIPYRDAVIQAIALSTAEQDQNLVNDLRARNFSHYAILACDKEQASNGTTGGSINPALVDLPFVGARETLQQRTFGTLPIADFVAEREAVSSIVKETTHLNIGFNRSLARLTKGNSITIDSTSLALTDSDENVMNGGVRLYLGLIAYENASMSLSTIGDGGTLFNDGEKDFGSKRLRFQRDWVDSNYYTSINNQAGLTNFTTDTFTTQTIMYVEPTSSLVGSRDHTGRYTVDSFGATLWSTSAHTSNPRFLEDTSDVSIFSLAEEHLRYWLQPVDNSGNIAIGNAVGLRYQIHTTVGNANYPFDGIGGAEQAEFAKHEVPFLKHVYLRVRCEVNKMTSNSSYDESVAVAEVMYSLYDYVAKSFGLIDSNLNIIDDGQMMTTLSEGISQGVRVLLDLNGAVWQDYEGNTSVNGRDLPNELQTQLSNGGLDPDIFDTSKYVHNFSVSTVFRSAYGASTFESHPLCISPIINHAFITYKASSL